MVKLIEMMLDEKLITKDAISTLVKSRPPKKISFANLIAENMIDSHSVEIYLAKKIRQGIITLRHLEKIEGIDITPILEEVAKELHIEYIDLDEVEIDMKLFSKVPYNQLIKYNIVPIEENGELIQLKMYFHIEKKKSNPTAQAQQKKVNYQTANSNHSKYERKKAKMKDYATVYPKC